MPLVQSFWAVVSDNSAWSNFFTWRKKLGLSKERD